MRINLGETKRKYFYVFFKTFMYTGEKEREGENTEEPHGCRNH